MKRAIVGILLTACLAGCNSGKRIAKANDALRVERETLKEQVTSLEAENAELKSKNSELNRRLESPLPEDVLDALPRVASVSLLRASSIESNEGQPTASFLLQTADGKGRFVQAVASVELRAVELGEQGEDARVIGERLVTPTELRESYASGFGGASYLLRVPLAQTPSSSVALRAVLHDAVTGASLKAERTVTPD